MNPQRELALLDELRHSIFDSEGALSDEAVLPKDIRERLGMAVSSWPARRSYRSRSESPAQRVWGDLVKISVSSARSLGCVHVEAGERGLARRLGVNPGSLHKWLEGWDGERLSLITDDTGRLVLVKNPLLHEALYWVAVHHRDHRLGRRSLPIAEITHAVTQLRNREPISPTRVPYAEPTPLRSEWSPCIGDRSSEPPAPPTTLTALMESAPHVNPRRSSEEREAEKDARDRATAAAGRAAIKMLEVLSLSERRVFEAHAEGHSLRDIGASLGIGKSTAGRHLTEARRKLLEGLADDPSVEHWLRNLRT